MYCIDLDDIMPDTEHKKPDIRFITELYLGNRKLKFDVHICGGVHTHVQRQEICINLNWGQESISGSLRKDFL